MTLGALLLGGAVSAALFACGWLAAARPARTPPRPAPEAVRSLAVFERERAASFAAARRERRADRGVSG